MPFYNFYDKKTKTEFVEFMSMSVLDEYLTNNPHIEQMPSDCRIVSGVDGIRRPDDGFKDLLKEMKKNHKGGNFGKFG